jgi:hypothetical protein
MPYTHRAVPKGGDHIHDQFCRCAICKPSLAPAHLTTSPNHPTAFLRPLEILIGFALVIIIAIVLAGL